MLKEVLGFCVECGGGEGSECLMKTAGGPVQDGVLPVGIVVRFNRLILRDLREDLLRGR